MKIKTENRMDANEFWKQEFGEEPQTDAEKLAVVMMRKYADYYSEKKCIEQKEICVNEIPDQKTARAQRTWLRIRKKILKAKLATDK